MSSENGSLTRNKSIKNDWLRAFREEFPETTLTENADWRTATTLGCGVGTFPLIECTARAELVRVCSFLIRHNQRIVPLGCGSNLVGSDFPVPETVWLRLSGEFKDIRSDAATRVTAGAGAVFGAILEFARIRSLGGMHSLAGIPGTLGGMIRMNAGARGREIREFLVSFDTLDVRTGEFLTRSTGEFPFGYRTSGLPEEQMIVSAILELIPVEPSEEESLFRAERAARAHNPKGRSAGSIFRNPSPMLSAGLLLDRAGMKGVRSGNCRVAEEHANWILCDGTGCSEEDFFKLITRMRERVYRETGVRLVPEVRFVNMETTKNMEKSIPETRVLVLKGGVSSEREISLESAENVVNALRSAGYCVSEYDLKELALPDCVREADVVFPVLHGGFGEDGRLQELLEKEKIRFVGLSSDACRILMDKYRSKMLMDAHGIPNPGYALLDDAADAVPEKLHFPLIVKPNSEGSTFGLTLLENEDGWFEALTEALKYDAQVLVEEYIDAVEATVGILLGEALPLVEIRYPGKIYDYDAKYTHAHGETQYFCPPDSISVGAQEEAQRFALAYARAAGAEKFCRVDVLVRRSDHKIFVLEGNAMPGCTASSLFPKAAKAAGIAFEELCSRLVQSAF